MKLLPGVLAVLFLVAFPRSSLSQDPPSTREVLNPWTEINNGLADSDVWSLAVSSDGELFAGTHAGLFRALDDPSTGSGGASTSSGNASWIPSAFWSNQIRSPTPEAP